MKSMGRPSRRGFLLRRNGQVTMEQAVLYTMVAAGIVFMGFYLQKAAQGRMKGDADQLGQQFSTNATTTWASFSRQTTTTSDDGKIDTTTGSCSKSEVGIGGQNVAAIADCTTQATTPPASGSTVGGPVGGGL